MILLLLVQVYRLMWQNYSAHKSCNCCRVIYDLVVAWSGILAHVGELQWQKVTSPPWQTSSPAT
jgi:hypothetical protein